MEMFLILLYVKNESTFGEAFMVNISCHFVLFAGTQTILHCLFLFDFHKIMQN